MGGEGAADLATAVVKACEENDEANFKFLYDVDKTIMKNALNLSQIKVRDCMVPRTEMVTIDISIRKSDNLFRSELRIQMSEFKIKTSEFLLIHREF